MEGGSRGWHPRACVWASTSRLCYHVARVPHCVPDPSYGNALGYSRVTSRLVKRRFTASPSELCCGRFRSRSQAQGTIPNSKYDQYCACGVGPACLLVLQLTAEYSRRCRLCLVATAALYSKPDKRTSLNLLLPRLLSERLLNPCHATHHCIHPHSVLIGHSG